jgi:thioesterase superfamily protein 4
MESALNRLKSIPWAAALINDPKWTPATTASRFPKPSGEDSFFAETLATERTIRALLTLRPVKEEEGDQAYTEIVEMIDLGDGLNGFPQIALGGFVATMLDEVCGVLIVLNVEKKIERLRKLGRLDSSVSMNYFTACKTLSLPLRSFN